MPGQRARILTQKEQILRGNEVVRFACCHDHSGTWVSLPTGPGASRRPPGQGQNASGS